MSHYLRRHIQFSGFLFALFGLVMLLLAGQVFTRSVVQAEPDQVWEDGVPVVSGDPRHEMDTLAVPTTPGTYYRTFAGTRFQSLSSSAAGA
jgi:hypothetical protein